MGELKLTRMEAFIAATNDKWVGWLDVLSGLSFLSAMILLAMKRPESELLLILALLLMLCVLGRTIWLAAAIRKGRRPPLPEEVAQRRKMTGAWISVVWFLLFGLLSVFLMRGAPGWMVCIPWGMVALAVVAAQARRLVVNPACMPDFSVFVWCGRCKIWDRM